MLNNSNIKPIKIISTQKKDTLEIRWNPNNICNFSCWYCFPGSNEGNHNSPNDLDLIIKNFNHLLNQYKNKLNKTNVDLKIAGGEPTLWKDLSLFLTEIKKENNIYITLISNGSRTLRWWKENGHLIDNLHLSYHVKEANLNHTIDVADFMYDIGKKITVKVLMDPTCWDQCIMAIEYLKKNSKNNFMIQVCEVLLPTDLKIKDIKIVNNDLNYNKDQKKYLSNGLKRFPNISWLWKNRKLIFSNKIRLYESIAFLRNGKKLKAKSETYINRSLNSFRGWECNIGVESVYVHWDGSLIGSCGQKLYGLDHSINILDKDFINKFNVELKPVICSINSCPCQPETHISKRCLA